MLRWIIDSKAFEYDKHYGDCKKSNHPFIKARKNLDTGKYLVFFDLATCNYLLSPRKQKDLIVLFDLISDKFESNSHTTKEYCIFDGIPTKKLDEFLSKSYKIIQKPT